LAFRTAVNEADSYHDFVVAMHGDEARPNAAYLICDHRFIRKYGLGLVRPVVSRIGASCGWLLICARSIEELAKSAGIDPVALRETSRRTTPMPAAASTQFGRAAG
jgi:hypothetical protein